MKLLLSVCGPFILLALTTAPTFAQAPEPVDPQLRQLAADVKAIGGEIQFAPAEGDLPERPVVVSLYDGNNPLKGKGGRNPAVNDAWLERLVGRTSITSLSTANCDVHRRGLEHVATLTKLERLNLTLCPVTDDDLRPVAALRGLTSLGLASTQCTGTAFEFLSDLTKLTDVNMHFTPANDAGLAAVSRHTSLERFWCVHAKFTDAGVRRLAALTNVKRMGLGSKEKGSSGEAIEALTGLSLVELELFDNQADDAGLRHAARIASLRLLTASYAPTATDESLAAVAAMSSLEEFKFGGARDMTDAGILQLAKCRSLKRVTLSQLKKVTDAGVEALRKAKPDLVVDRK